MPPIRAPMIEFLEKYRELECLWKVTHKDYRNKQKRLTALKQLLEIAKKRDARANIDTIIKKINSLRSSFNKEYNKVKASQRAGPSTHDVHRPKLWYYDLLLFLRDKDSQSTQPSDITAILNDSTNGSKDVKIKPSSPCFSQSSISTNVSNGYESSNSSQNVSKKRKLKNTTTEVLSKICKRLDVHKVKLQYNAFGEHVAEKLRSMPDNMAIFCQKIINDAIFNADCGNLNYSSHIVTDCEQQRVQLSQTEPPHVRISSQSCNKCNGALSYNENTTSLSENYDIKDENDTI